MMMSAVTLSNPKSGSSNTSRSAGVMLARRRYFNLRKLSVYIVVSESALPYFDGE